MARMECEEDLVAEGDNPLQKKGSPGALDKPVILQSTEIKGEYIEW